MTKRKIDRESPAQPSFEDAVARLTAIVGQLEEGQIGLEQSLAIFEEGVGLFRRCYELLERAQRRMEILTGVDADGNPRTRPLDDDALSLEEKARQRSRRRTASRDAPIEPPPETDPPDRNTDEAGRLF